jgi:hypothetical protein
MAWKLEAYDLDPETVKAWFAAGPVSTDYTGYVAENEAVFVRGNEALRLQCSYRDGCPHVRRHVRNELGIPEVV